MFYKRLIVGDGECLVPDFPFLLLFSYRVLVTLSVVGFYQENSNWRRTAILCF